jgi:hypothetical protein
MYLLSDHHKNVTEVGNIHTFAFLQTQLDNLCYTPYEILISGVIIFYQL